MRRPTCHSNRFETRDFYLTCHLVSCGFEPSELVRNGRVATFVFGRTPDLEKAIQTFFAPGPVRRFVHAIRDLKSRLYADQ